MNGEEVPAGRITSKWTQAAVEAVNPAAAEGPPRSTPILIRPSHLFDRVPWGEYDSFTIVIRRLLITVAFIGAASVFSGVLPLARFTGETIIIELLANHILVDGTYVYENPLPFTIRQGMTVPLPPGNEAIGLDLKGDGHVLPLRHIFGAYRFELPLRAHQKVLVHLRYEQYTPSHSATYLLTTTAPWHRPIDHGLYRIRTRGYRVVRSSYTLTNGAFERGHFMPPADWSFAWQ